MDDDDNVELGEEPVVDSYRNCLHMESYTNFGVSKAETIFQNSFLLLFRPVLLFSFNNEEEAAISEL